MAAESTLFIGDSHSYFEARNEERLGAILVQSFPDLNFYGACGSSPNTWTKGGTTSCGWRAISPSGLDEKKLNSSVPKLVDLLAKHQPKQIWIEQGDNMFTWSATKPATGSVNKNLVKTQIQALLSLLHSPEWKNLPCTWIGPTWGGNGSLYKKTDAALADMYEELQAHLGERCKLIDSRKLLRAYAGSDGLHLSRSASKEWGENLVRVLGR